VEELDLGYQLGPHPMHAAEYQRRAEAKEVRVREYLTEDKCRSVIAAARKRGGRYGLRDALAIRMCWWHGLRVSELVARRSDHIEWKTARLTVHRAKGSVDSTHPISGDELRKLRGLQRTQEAGCRFVFMNERGAPMTAAGFRKMLSTVGATCGLPHVHPHMLRHSCGFYMADRREDVRVMQDWGWAAPRGGSEMLQKLMPARDLPIGLRERRRSKQMAAASLLCPPPRRDRISAKTADQIRRCRPAGSPRLGGCPLVQPFSVS
jgi:integrase